MQIPNEMKGNAGEEEGIGDALEREKRGSAEASHSSPSFSLSLFLSPNSNSPSHPLQLGFADPLLPLSASSLLFTGSTVPCAVLELDNQP
ncbi:hypothetical protein VNO80_28291 [Phaseolus coccineus]|uniref:Uncharacterized protein n=1 Tax=Phaseolus coccineus TaxID=3886 RepID=A0AAN9L8S6_PHACN